MMQTRAFHGVLSEHEHLPFISTFVVRFISLLVLHVLLALLLALLMDGYLAYVGSKTFAENFRTAAQLKQ
jgi:hypothetical protein